MTLASPWLGVGITVFAWWISTGLILLLVRIRRAWHLGALTALGIFALASVWGFIASANNDTIPAVYCGFFCALVIWGWHEASFLMGFVTGPRPAPCPPDAKGWRRFGYATATLIYHEIALFVTLAFIAVFTWGSANPIALWTFAVLFAMRLSSKFNIFLGVPNLTEEFFPDHLEHLKSYLPKRAMNGLMPVSILACLIAGAIVWTRLDEVAGQSRASLSLVIGLTLIGLGLLEHIFMITPLPDAALWRWAAPLPLPIDPALKKSLSADGTHLKKQKNV
jgi:putative photosynthetic complex assembly protein 2